MNVHNGRISRSDHRRHDRLLVARFAMDDAYPTEREDARRLLTSCAECAALATDIRLVAQSVSRIPHPARPRDFTITAAQAERLAGSRLSRWLRSLAAPGWATLRPVAGVALSMGLVMAVVGAALPRVPADTGIEIRAAIRTSAGEPTGDSGAGVTGETLVPVAAPGLEAPDQNGSEFVATASQDPVTSRVNDAYVEVSPAPGEAEDHEAARIQSAAAADPTRELLIYGGLVVAALSVGLLALAWAARRYFADPLLR